MTIIKYATVVVARTSRKVLLIRGEESGLVGYLPPEDEDEDVFGDPIHAERVVDLPEPMTPTEYEEYVEENYGLPEDDPLTKATVEVAEENGLENPFADGDQEEASA